MRSATMAVSAGLTLTTKFAYAGANPFQNTPRVKCSPTKIGENNFIRGRPSASINFPEPKRKLGVGEWMIIPNLCPEVKYFPTSVILSAGSTYEFSAQGKWKDKFIVCGPDGWPGLILQAGNRIAWQRMFLLCGSIGETDQYAFPIGSGRKWSAPQALNTNNTELYLFANDWLNMYNNNASVPESDGGPMRVSIRRVS